MQFSVNISVTNRFGRVAEDMTAVFDRNIDQWDEDGMCFRVLNHRGNPAPWAMNLIGSQEAEWITWKLSQAVYSYENNYFNQ